METPSIIRYIRNASALRAPVSIADIIYAYTRFPEHFDTEIKELEGRKCVPEDMMDRYLEATIAAYTEQVEKVHIMPPQRYMLLTPEARGAYEATLRRAMADRDKKIDAAVREFIEPYTRIEEPDPHRLTIEK